MSRASLEPLLSAHPEIERVEAFVMDVNGVARGKWLSRDKMLASLGKGLPLPRSIVAQDVWGCDVEGAGLALAAGDPDGTCREVPGTAAIVPWAARPTAQVMLRFVEPDGGAFFGEPRAALSRVVEDLVGRGWRAVVAAELEFYLFDPSEPGCPRPPGSAGTRWLGEHGQVLGLGKLREHEALFDDLQAACDLQGLPADTMLRESGAGQYEVNLHHVADPLLAADQAVLLKRAVKCVARRHGLAATFMAKPYGAQPGSGMHVHCSLLDRDGRPLLAGDGGKPGAMLDHAVAGLIATMPDAMLLFAPHANSYRRFLPRSHAPTRASWAIDDRTAAVRVIVGSPEATRIEQRVAGADCNPYLAIAAILAGMLEGIDRAAAPPPPGREAATPLPREWGAAIDAFSHSSFVADRLGAPFRDLLVACKRQDHAEILSRVSDVELAAYLDLA